jgi:hypothetical protein
VSLVPAVVRSTPQYLRDWATELRAGVCDDRRYLLCQGVRQEDLARHGELQLAWADLLDAIAGRRE